MQVILLERVPKLGQMGDVVTVRDGYGRNFLIPRGKALRATKDAMSGFERRRKQLEARNLELKGEAETAAADIAGRMVVILRQASESAQLYGSVSARDIAVAFAADGVSLDRQQIRLDQPLKALGVHEVTVALHPEVEVAVKVNIARSPQEADAQVGIIAPSLDEDDEEEDIEALIAAAT